MKVHSLADVQTDKIGAGTQVWQFAVILSGAKIGSNCNINCHTFIENEVTLGNNVTIKSGVYLWDGVVLEDSVFIGPNVTFTNDKYPRSKNYPSEYFGVKVQHHASIGAAATILGGVTIGSYALVAAGALVTKSIPSRALVAGAPARIIGWVNINGTRMKQLNPSTFEDLNGDIWKVVNNQLCQK